jgi:hypothetical protein
MQLVMLPFIDFCESHVQLIADITINRSVPEVYSRQWLHFPVIVARVREVVLHVFETWVNEDGCQISHASSSGWSIEIDQILNVNPIILRNFNTMCS